MALVLPPDRPQEIRLDSPRLDVTRLDAARRVSHGLRTPLACVRGYLELLIDGEFGDVSAEQAAALDVVMRNVDRLSEAVEAAIVSVACDEPLTNG